ncbi:MAG: radical SAM protein [bacterium]|nr:radical SAM protein [bacterium]
MKILLIAPSSGHWRQVGRRRLVSGETFRFSMLSLLSVAAATPRGVDIRIVDEQFDDVPWNERFDLAGLTVMTAAAPRAYEIADRLRERAIPVVMGGMHPTFLPDEALRHADAVVKGEAEPVWAELIEDARAGRLRPVYEAERPFDMANLTPPPYELLSLNRYSSYAVQATRGCDRRCSFCSVSAFNHYAQRRRPVESVIEEVKLVPSRFFVFVDDNLTSNRDYALALFDALSSCGKQWVSQSTLAIADDAELLNAASKAGCVGLFTGMETISDENLQSVEKGFHQAERYREWIARLHERGIGVEAGVVFGFDGDDPGVFRRTLDRLDDLQVDAAQISIFTPLPGTQTHEMMRDRILDWNWSHYDFHQAVFHPRRMSVEALKAGHDWVTREFYSPARIAKRMARWVSRPNGILTAPYAAALNVAYLARIHNWGIRGWDPGREVVERAPRVFSLSHS